MTVYLLSTLLLRRGSGLLWLDQHPTFQYNPFLSTYPEGLAGAPGGKSLDHP